MQKDEENSRKKARPCFFEIARTKIRKQNTKPSEKNNFAPHSKRTCRSLCSPVYWQMHISNVSWEIQSTPKSSWPTARMENM